jgi:hypothetical protein
MKAQGWYRDPYSVHEDRYFSEGQPTKLVRDGGAESYDPPPAGPPPAHLAEVPQTSPTDGSDLRRADDRAAGPASCDRKKPSGPSSTALPSTGP